MQPRLHPGRMSKAPGARRVLVALLALFLAPVRAGDVAPHVQVASETRYYDVEASSIEELRAALARVGTGADGQPVEGLGGGHGRTRTTLSVMHSLQPGDGACRAADLRIEARIVTTLPRWRGRVDAPTAVRKRWDRAIAALALHERIHRRHARRAIGGLARGLAAIGSRPDCADVRRAIFRERLAAGARWRWEDDKYDRRTRNGLAQGTEI